MFRITLLIICGVFIVADISKMISEEKVRDRLIRFVSAVIYGVIFYYIWFT